MFTGGHGKSAAMSSQCRPHFVFGAIRDQRLRHSEDAPKGRVISNLQKCQTDDTLPNQFTGGQRAHAAMPQTPRPHFVWGQWELAFTPFWKRPEGKGQYDSLKVPYHIHPSQPVYRGPTCGRSNATPAPPPPNLGHPQGTVMSSPMRPITRGQPFSAEMPTLPRLETKKGK